MAMLSKKTKYAMNALIYLAHRHGQGVVTIGEVAEAEHIPHKFLEAIMLDLKKAGILNSRKGKGGGYYLYKKPEDVNLADVMSIFDGPLSLLPCVSQRHYERCEECKDESTCGIRAVFMELRGETIMMLKAANLAEVIRREGLLQKAFKYEK